MATMKIFGGKLELTKKTEKLVDNLYEYLIEFSNHITDEPYLDWLDYVSDWKPPNNIDMYGEFKDWLSDTYFEDWYMDMTKLQAKKKIAVAWIYHNGDW